MLGPSSAAFLGVLACSDSDVEQLGFVLLAPVWDARVTGGILMHTATIPSPSMNFHQEIATHIGN